MRVFTICLNCEQNHGTKLLVRARDEEQATIIAGLITGVGSALEHPLGLTPHQLLCTTCGNKLLPEEVISELDHLDGPPAAPAEKSKSGKGKSKTPTEGK